MNNSTQDNPFSAKTILIAPHNDDEALFASFTCLREKPLVIIVTDSWKQFNRGEKNITAEARRQESIDGMTVLGCAVHFLAIPDNKLTRTELRKKLREFHPTTVYAPAIQGGNAQHDLVGATALECFPNVIQYTTYSKASDYTTGEAEIIPTPEELELKNQALECYRTQMSYERTAHHFHAVKGKSEWLIKNIKNRFFITLWNRLKK